MLVICLHLAILSVISCSDPEQKSESEERAIFLKKKWSMANVIRDLDHIKHDLQEMMDLKETGQISRNEMIFYMIRMHDFDDNGGLDGIELRAAFTHSMEHKDSNEDQNIEELIEQTISIDMNNDGFIDYAEFIIYLRNSEKEEQ